MAAQDILCVTLSESAQKFFIWILLPHDRVKGSPDPGLVT